MPNDILVSLINPRGRVVWISEDKVTELREQGWRQIVNPKEVYYPQYDTSLASAKSKDDDEGIGTHLASSDSFENRLGIIIL